MASSAPVLPDMEVAPRLGRLRTELAGAACDVLLISNLVNIRWLTGFTGSRALLVVSDVGATLVTDARYDEQAGSELAAASVVAEVAITRDEGPVVAAAVAGRTSVGVEADDITWSRLRQVDEEWLPASEIVPTTGLVSRLRRMKDPGELARIEAAATIADAAVEAVAQMLASGCAEREVAFELDSAMRRLGAAGPAFETIVAAGANGSLPHARPTERAVTATDLVIVDLGAVVDGYHSDMTRTWSAGDPDDFQLEIWETVVEAQAAGVAAVREGVAANVVDAACREVIGAAGWGDNFVHGTGHGVGLEIHEVPWLGAQTEGALGAGDVITVEPGIYVPGRAGVRIEDTVVVTAAGCCSLTCTEKAITLPVPA
jgi:Xaa-Pro aminopeptidase